MAALGLARPEPVALLLGRVAGGGRRRGRVAGVGAGRRIVAAVAGPAGARVAVGVIAAQRDPDGEADLITVHGDRHIVGCADLKGGQLSAHVHLEHAAVAAVHQGHRAGGAFAGRVYARIRGNGPVHDLEVVGILVQAAAIAVGALGLGRRGAGGVGVQHLDVPAAVRLIDPAICRGDLIGGLILYLYAEGIRVVIDIGAQVAVDLGQCLRLVRIAPAPRTAVRHGSGQGILLPAKLWGMVMGEGYAKG